MAAPASPPRTNANAIVTGEVPPPLDATGAGAVVDVVVVATRRFALRRAFLGATPACRRAPPAPNGLEVLLVTGASPGAEQSPVAAGVSDAPAKSLPLTSG